MAFRLYLIIFVFAYSCMIEGEETPEKIAFEKLSSFYTQTEMGKCNESETLIIIELYNFIGPLLRTVDISRFKKDIFKINSIKSFWSFIFDQINVEIDKKNENITLEIEDIKGLYNGIIENKDEKILELEEEIIKRKGHITFLKHSLSKVEQNNEYLSLELERVNEDLSSKLNEKESKIKELELEININIREINALNEANSELNEVLHNLKENESKSNEYIESMKETIERSNLKEETLNKQIENLKNKNSEYELEIFSKSKLEESTKHDFKEFSINYTTNNFHDIKEEKKEEDYYYSNLEILSNHSGIDSQDYPNSCRLLDDELSGFSKNETNIDEKYINKTNENVTDKDTTDLIKKENFKFLNQIFILQEVLFPNISQSYTFSLCNLYDKIDEINVNQIKKIIADKIEGIAVLHSEYNNKKKKKYNKQII